jgi:colicin import membrane protein
MLTISPEQIPAMKRMRNATFLIAACALFHWASAQNSTENTFSSVAAAAASTASAQRASEEQARARIVQEKAAIAAEYEATKVDCYQKFQVNSCLADARSVRISRSTAVKRQEVLLNDAQRKRRGDEQLQRTQEKALARGEDAVSAQPIVSTQTSGSQTLPVLTQRPQRAEQKAAAQQSAAQAAQARKSEVANKQATAANKTAARKARQVQAAEAKARYEANQKDAEAHRANVLTRQQAAKKKAAPLAVPPN